MAIVVIWVAREVVRGAARDEHAAVGLLWRRAENLRDYCTIWTTFVCARDCIWEHGAG